MKKDSWLVTLDDTRSISGGRGIPTKCFYCPAAINTEHEPGCVCRKRTVVIEARFELVIIEPEDWDQDQIEFGLNESSSCANNVLDKLNALQGRVNCLCGHFDGSYLREATEEDEANNQLFVDTSVD